MQDVLTEVMALFPGKFIHIGGDEAPKNQWKASPRAQERMKTLGIATENELQSWFTTKMDAFLTSHGRRLVGWDEILEGGLAPNAVVMSWRGTAGGLAAARAGHDVIMTPGSHTYFDHYQSLNQAAEPLAIGGFLPIDTVYSYEPVPGRARAPVRVAHSRRAGPDLDRSTSRGRRTSSTWPFRAQARLPKCSGRRVPAETSRDFSARLPAHLARLRVLACELSA